MFGLGFTLEAGPPPGVAAAYAFTHGEAASLVARFAVPPSTNRKMAIDTLVGALKSAGLWAKLDCLWILAAHDEQAALCNWKGEANTLTLGGAPLFVPNRGHFTDGVDDYLHCNYVPSTHGVAYTLNSAMFGCWTRYGGTQTNGTANMGTISSGANRLNPRGSTDTVAANVNSSSNTIISTATVTSGYGLLCADRISSSQVKLMKNGARLHAGAAASISVPTTAMTIGRSNNLFAQNQYAAAFIGGSLSDAEHLSLYNALSAYMASVGMSNPAITSLLPVTSTRNLTSAITLPDGASGATAAKGWTCTGLTRLPDGSYLVGNDGRLNTSDTVNKPSIVHLSADGTTILHQWTSSAMGLPAASIQGVAWEGIGTGGIRGNIWFVLKTSPTATACCLPIADNWSGGSPTILPTAYADANGIALDTQRNQIILCVNAASATLRWFDRGDLTRPLRTVPLNYGTDNDHLSYNAAEDAVYVTVGANGTNGRLYRMPMDGAGYGGPVNVEEITLTGADAIEGVAWVGTTMMIANDAYFHGGVPALNRLLAYAAP